MYHQERCPKREWTCVLSCLKEEALSREQRRHMFLLKTSNANTIEERAGAVFGLPSVESYGVFPRSAMHACLPTLTGSRSRWTIVYRPPDPSSQKHPVLTTYLYSHTRAGTETTEQRGGDYVPHRKERITCIVSMLLISLCLTNIVHAYIILVLFRKRLPQDYEGCVPPLRTLLLTLRRILSLIILPGAVKRSGTLDASQTFSSISSQT